MFYLPPPNIENNRYITFKAFFIEFDYKVHFDGANIIFLIFSISYTPVFIIDFFLLSEV